MRGLTFRKFTVIRLAGYHTGFSCVALLSYQFPRIVGNGIGPNAGRDPRLWATQSSHPPACRRGPGMAPRTLSSTRDAPPLAEAGFHRPPGPVPPFVHHAAAYWREGFAQPVAGRRLILRAILRPIRRYARSCCATAPPSQRLGAAPLRRAVLFLLERPPALGSPAVDPRGELSE